MIVTLIIIFIICLIGIHIGESSYEGYLSKERTASIKGVFILLVFLSHIKGYIQNAGYVIASAWGGEVFLFILGFLGQLIVVMFLFYSGYGVMESIRNKGSSYVSMIPRHRVLNTLINFDVAVCCFFVACLLLGNRVGISRFFLSLIAWDSIGNSNWYIFVIIICYIATWLCASIARKPTHIVIALFIILTLIIAVLNFTKEPYWYNTIWAYGAGVLYSAYKCTIESIIKKKYFLTIIVLSVLFILIYKVPFEAYSLRTNCLSVVFALLVVALSMRVSIDNVVLRWCGTNLFPLYIYQRLPMLVFEKLLPAWIISSYPLCFVAVCFLITVFISIGYKFFKVSL